MMTNSIVYRRAITLNDFWQGDNLMMPHSRQLTKAEHDYHTDPNNETAVRTLIHAYQNAGRRDDALRVGLRLLLHLDTVNRLPEPETHRLIQSLIVTPSVAAPPRSVSRRSLFAVCAAVAVCGIGTVALTREHTAHKQSVDISLKALEHEADILAEEAFLCYQKGEYDTAYIRAQTARDKYVVAGAVAAEGKVCLTIGQIFQAWGKFPAAQYWITKGTAQIRRAGKPLQVAYALNIATLLDIKLGNLEQAQHQNEQSLQIRTAEAEEAGVIECLRERGTILAEQGDYRAAETAWGDAEQRARKAKKPDMIASLNYLRGTYAIHQGKPGGSYLASSLDYWTSVGQEKWQADVILRQAESDVLALQFASAQTRLKFCRKVYTAKKSQLGLTDCDVVDAMIALVNKETTKASSKFSAAMAFYNEAGLKPRNHHANRLISLLKRP